MTQVSEPAAGGYRVKGWHVGAGISAFFALVFVFDGYFTWLAFKTFPGEVSTTPYEDGLAYNRTLAQGEAQARLGWRAMASAEQGLAVLEFEGPNGRPVEGLTISATLIRPATDSGRLTPAFKEAAPGRYEAPTGRIAGAWDLTAVATDAQGRTFRAQRRLTWP